MKEEDRALTHHLSVAQISMDAYHQLWHQEKKRLEWNCLFVLPFWLDTVYKHLGAHGKPAILTISEGTDLIGIVPLALNEQTACFLGNPEVCDYQDIVAAPGKAELIMDAVINHLSGMNIRQLDLRTLRPNSATLTALETLKDKNGLKVVTMADDVTYEARLPDSWEDFLQQLNSKQRHEVRRKLRRLSSQVTFNFHMARCDRTVDESAARFVQLFQMNRADKAQFMGPRMTDYFIDLIRTLARQKMLRLYFLDLDGQPAATVLCFDYDGVRYLYNSGYDAQYHKLSVGILSKVFSIQEGIASGCRSYDFLKGSEAYKKRTGGQQVPLYRCQINL